MSWACLWLPQLALDGVLRDQVDPVRPLALVTGGAQRRLLVAVNESAAAAGLRTGQTLAAAQALLANFTAIEYDAGANARWQRLLAGVLYRYSSQVSLDFPDALLLEVAGSLKLFGPWPRFAAQLHDDLDALGFRHQLVLAPNPCAALVLAQNHAELALDTPSTLLGALAQITIDRASLPVTVADALRAMGLRTLRQVFALPRAAVVRRFGPDLLLHLDRLRGNAPQPLTWYQPPDHFDERIEFNYEVESSEALWFPLRRLVHDLAAFLTGRDGGVQRFDVLLEHEGRAATEARVGLLGTERDPRLLFEIAQSRLAQTSVPAPVRGLRLRADELPPFVPAGADLFAPNAAQTLAWPQLRERLRARLGAEQVYTLSVQEDHRPERAWQRQADLPSPRCSRGDCSRRSGCEQRGWPEGRAAGCRESGGAQRRMRGAPCGHSPLIRLRHLLPASGEK
ncbi:MAG: DNA polymerase Y family protein, partial [Lysobacterales bacterium]